ncbi:MAG: T9SS type A sorting domain-containing protein [bacterium]|nr:T9SS type A sorting domain-containing protein [bacterium]
MKNRIKIIALLVFSVWCTGSFSQCINGFSFGSATAGTTTTPVPISGCNWQGDYATISGIVAGNTYEAGVDIGGCVTVTSGTPGGPVVAFGNAPLSFIAPSSGTYYFHYNTNCTTCGTASTCATTTVTCTSCGGGGSPDPCASITNIPACGSSVTANMSGSGAGWSTSFCGFTTPGEEVIYSFTPTTSGTYSIDVTGISGGFIDFAWVDASLGCSSAAPWNCIGDIFSTGSYGAMNWVAGTTYYILLDAEGTGAYSTTFSVQCPTAGTGPCASITPLIGCGTNTGATVSGTGAGWDISSCGFTTPGTEMIFSFTATASGIHSIDINSSNGAFVDMFWMDATTGCSQAGPWNCISDFSAPGNYGSMNWIAGNTYYILFDAETTGTSDWTFDVNCPNPTGPVTASDCSSRAPVCTDSAFQIDPNGYGLVDELCTNCTSNPSTNPSSANTGCLNSGELNSTWFEVNVSVGGTLEFSFGTAGTGNCYDWIMWPLTPTACTDIIGNTHAPVSCNWNFPCDGFTGAAGTLPPGGQAGNFEPALNVNAGDQFIICFSNFSSALTTVPIDFFGTADISCSTLPLPVGLIEFSGEDLGGFNMLRWKTGAELHNAGFYVERSENLVDFETIGFVEGMGNTLDMTEYVFKDLNPSRTVTYYRLKQLDFNGSITYSKVISVVQSGIDEMQVVNFYPNPAQEQFNVDIVAAKSGELDIEVYSTGGNMLSTFTKSIEEGSNVLHLNTSELKAGMYMVRIINQESGKTEVIRFTVE